MKPDFPIETDRLYLRSFTPDDATAIYGYHGREDVTKYLLWNALSFEQVQEKLDRWKTLDGDWPDGDCLAVALIHKDSGVLIGDCALNFGNRAARQAEIGYSMHPDYQGFGYMAEACSAMMKIGFELYDLHRVSGRCDVRNLASASVMERLNMRREAHFVEHALFKGEWDEEYVYAILQREWRNSQGSDA